MTHDRQNHMMNKKSKQYLPNEGGTHIAFGGVEAPGKKLCCQRTPLEVILFVMFCISTAVAVALIIVLATRTGPTTVKQTFIKEQTITSDFKGHKLDLTQRDPADTTLEDCIEEHTDELCLTEDCVKAAARLLESMDTAVDPCDDFFEYSCGSWNRLNDIPDDRSSYNTFAKLRDIIHVQLKDLLQQPRTEQDSEGTLKAKRLYQSCVNESLIDERDLDPVYVLLEELGGWPITGTNLWKEEEFDLISLMVKLRLYNNKILVDQWVGPDDKNSEVNIVQLDQAELGMPSREYYMKGHEDVGVQVYEQFAINVAILFGANESNAEREIREMIDFEIELANLTTPQELRRDNELLYNKLTALELQERIPKFNWIRYLSEVFQQVNLTFNASEEIVVYAPEYLSNMVDLITNTSNRTLVNYLIWRIMMNRVTNLPDKYRELRKEYHKTIYGSETERSRWRDCVSYVNDNMGNAVGRLFISKHFDENAKKSALEMIGDIRVAVNELLDEVEWMDEETKIVAQEKANAMAVKIGYPGYILNNTALDEEYTNVNFHPDTYFENVLENIRGIAISNLQLFHQPVDKSMWSTTPAVVNAFYSSAKNQIMFPAGILQPPFYSKGYPKSLNYGGIGMVIGHEITHGFDDRGRQYDKDGNLKQWWDDQVIEKFKEQAQCMIDQYGNYTIDPVGIHLNGIQTQGENIADNGGLKEAYRAYQKWKAEHKQGEPRLPGLSNFNHDQLFFLNFAQVWCGTMRPQAILNRVRTGVHSPGRFRVIGTLQNSVDFARVFNCPLNSYMNPEKKCSLW